MDLVLFLALLLNSGLPHDLFTHARWLGSSFLWGGAMPIKVSNLTRLWLACSVARARNGGTAGRAWRAAVYKMITAPTGRTSEWFRRRGGGISLRWSSSEREQRLEFKYSSVVIARWTAGLLPQVHAPTVSTRHILQNASAFALCAALLVFKLA